MKQFSRTISTLDQLMHFLSAIELRESSNEASSTLVQIFTASQDTQWLRTIASKIEAIYPYVHIVGATTCGEIYEGETIFGQTTVTFYFFRTTHVHPIVISCASGEELEIGRQLRRTIDRLGNSVPAVMLLTTPLTIDSNELIRGLNNPPPSFQTFGGGAGDNAMKNNHVVCGSTIYPAAAIAVAFEGPDFQVEKTSYIGWKPLSHEMTVTKASGLTIHTIDDHPALEIYRRYFDIQDDENFFSEALGFPLLACRENSIIALVPVAVGPDASLEFISEVQEGEKFRIGFMDPILIRDNSIAAQRKMMDFEPEAILLFSCGSRRWVLREDVLAETKPFQEIAPTTGFYTIGEFCNNDGKMPVLNLAFVVVGMRESSPSGNSVPIQSPIDITKSISNDIYISTHSAVLTRLLHFIHALNGELEQAHHKILIQSITDKLTKVYNRTKLDDSLNSELARSRRSGSPFSIVLLDIDHFKEVNDQHGHNVGDAVLVRMAEILGENIRCTDVLGRWGGEEFLILLTETGPEQACFVAEKLRTAIAKADFPHINHKTASFGVTAYQAGDDIGRILGRADEALYEAKHKGRNIIVQK